MARDGKLRLKLRDVYGEPIQEKVDIRLRHQVLSDPRIVKGVSGSKTIVIPDLNAAPRGLYRIQIDPPSYMPVGQFINIRSSGFTDLEIRFPIDPNKIDHVEFPAFAGLEPDLRGLLESSGSVFQFEGRSGEDLYNSLDDIRKAGLMNIVAKARVTPLANETVVLPGIESLLELRGDRFFAVSPKALREETKNSVSSGLFDSVSSALHRPPEGFEAAGSFKTDDRYGNLQLTFSMKGDETRVDEDIDDANGLEHVFQVLRNHLTGRPTHLFDIHQILFRHQNIDSGYRLVV